MARFRRRRLTRRVIAAVAFGALAVTPAPTLAQTAALSADGRVRAWSDGTNLFAFDRASGTTETVNRDADGAVVAASGPAVDWNGRWVAFSSAGALVRDDTNRVSDVYLRDRRCGYTERLSVGPEGVQLVGASSLTGISANGRHVAFTTASGTLVPDDRDGVNDVIVRDRATGADEIVSLDAAGRHVSERVSGGAISADGRYVILSTDARLTPDDRNTSVDLFVRDRVARTTERVSVDTEGRSGFVDSPSVAISADGRYVAFTWSTPAEDDGWERPHVWVRDRVTRRTQRISVGRDGAPLPAAGSPSMSADGERVAFLAGHGSQSTEYPVGVRDRRQAATRFLPFRPDTTTGTTMSADGRWVAWTSAPYPYRTTYIAEADLGAAAARPLPTVPSFTPGCTPPPLAGRYSTLVLNDRPASLWRLGESSGTTARDATGYRPGTYRGATLGVEGALSGDPDTAVRLARGAGANVEIGDSFDYVDRAPFTVEAWVKPGEQDERTQRIVSKESPTAGWLLGVKASGLVFSRFAGGQSRTARTPLPTGTWSHVAATYDGQTLRLYVDGVRQVSVASLQDLPNRSEPLRLGAKSDGGRGLNGSLDEVAIYHKALLGTQLLEHAKIGRGT